MTKAIQVTGPGFCTKITVHNGDVIEASQALAWATGKPYKWVRRRLFAEGCTLEDLGQVSPTPDPAGKAT